MASRESAMKGKICEYLREAIKTMPDLSAVTMRMLKDKIAPKFGDEWEEVSSEYKAFIKDEAVKLITEAETSADKSPEKEKKKKTDSVETKLTPLTVQKKDGRIKPEVSIPSKKRKGNSSSDGDCSDDFKEESSRNSSSSKASKKKDVKIQRKEEPSQKKESAPVQSAEVIRLKSLAKQCG
jgi:hypothetical protein